MPIDCREIELWASQKPDEVVALAKRFDELDATLSPDDIARAYVAQAYVKNNSSDIDFDGMMLDSMVKTGDYENALRMAWDLVCRSPFNLHATETLLHIVPKEHDIWKLAAWRYTHLLNAILSTGDGTSPQSAFCVICVQDEYIVMRGALEIENILQQSLEIEGERSYDRFDVAAGDRYPHSVIYFDITPFNIYAD